MKLIDMRLRYKQLRRVEVPHPGPTCKADCLNWIVKAIFLHEEQYEMQFWRHRDDSEDVLHPLELHLFNYLLPRMDMIQLPVTSLEREWYELVAGTYMDEFAEWHGKDMLVRESMSHVVPSAGVGTCFSRRALMALSSDAKDEPFNTQSLTEDYEVANHLGRLGMRMIFVRFPVQYRIVRHAWFGWKPDQEVTVTMPLCVREYFPKLFRSAYRAARALDAGHWSAKLGNHCLARGLERALHAVARPQGHCDRVCQHFCLRARGATDGLLCRGLAWRLECVLPVRPFQQRLDAHAAAVQSMALILRAVSRTYLSTRSMAGSML